MELTGEQILNLIYINKFKNTFSFIDAMEEAFKAIGERLIELYNELMGFLPSYVGNFFNFLILVLLVVLYAIIIWKFYRFVSKKNLIELNLNQYNKSEHPLIAKVIAGAFYLLEYIIILPFIIFIWFSVFTLFLIFLTENLEISTVLITSATIVAAIRMTSYYKEELAKDLAKLLPFMLLAISILNPNFFNVERILGHFSEIPGFLNNIIIYLAFIIVLEVILRLFEFIFSIFELEDKTSGEDSSTSEEKEEK